MNLFLEIVTQHIKFQAEFVYDKSYIVYRTSQQSCKAAIAMVWHRQNKLLKVIIVAYITSPIGYLWPDARLHNY